MDAGRQFDAAAQYVAAAASSKALSDAHLLELYGLFKQATMSDCSTPKPSFFDRRGRAKWHAWQSCHGLSESQAQRQYVQRLHDLVPGWDPGSISMDTATRAGAGGPVQSRMAQSTEDDIEVSCH